jgi:sugar phosphate isomerase/epimerase
MQRRDFLSLSALAGTAALLAPATRATGLHAATAATTGPAATTAQLNLCHQWDNIPGKAFNEKLDYLEANGYAAVELPTKGDWLLKNHAAFKKAMQGRRLTLATACGPSDFSHADPAKREAEVRKFLPQIEVLGDLKSVGLILCPARKTIPMGAKELREDFSTNTGRRLAEHAAKHGTNIVLEPLTREETPFLNRVSDAAAIARAMRSSGAKVMGDLWHMSKEETSCRDAFISGGDLLVHVHIASLGNRKVPGSEPSRDHDKYVDGFRGLKAINYRGAVSFEGGTPRGDRTKIYSAMAAYIRACWSEA